MLIGILPNVSDAEILLNNLSEADFDLNNVSMIMRDAAIRNKIAKDVGPFKGVQPEKIMDELVKAGMSKSTAKLCTDALAQSKVLVAMNVSADLLASAREMFTDESAQIVKE